MKPNLVDRTCELLKWMCNYRKLHNTTTREQLWYVTVSWIGRSDDSMTMRTCLYQAVYVWGKSASYPDINYFSHKKCSFLIRNNCHSLATQRRLYKRQKRIYSCATQNISSNSFQMYLNILFHLRSSSWSKLCIVIRQTHPLGPRHDQLKYI